MRRFPVSVYSVAKASDFEDRSDTKTLVVRTGARIRHLSNEELVRQELSAVQEALEVELSASAQLNAVTSAGHVFDVFGNEYRILRINRFDFKNRRIRFIIGRNA